MSERPPSRKRAVLTIASGQPRYLRLAVNLARSFLWWHKNSAIDFFLVTDLAHLLPKDLANIQVIKLAPNELGIGFSTKLHLDKIAPAEQTLFVDSDCLCVGPLDTVFDRFAGRPVGVIGHYMTQGEWFGDVAKICQHFGLPRLPKFNGGVYYVEPGPICSQVYAKARELEPSYDKLGLIRLRNQPNDELLIAIGMALNNLGSLPDDGTIFGDPVPMRGKYYLDVLRGGCRLVNPPTPPDIDPFWVFRRESRPLLAHFLSRYTERYPYLREELRLELAQARGWPLWQTDALAFVLRTLPLVARRTLGDCLEFVKYYLRPAYYKWAKRRLAS